MMTDSHPGSVQDVEKGATVRDYAHLTNDTVQNFSWSNVTVTVTDRATKKPLDILSGVSGMVEAGEVVALMGPRYASLHFIISSHFIPKDDS